MFLFSVVVFTLRLAKYFFFFCNKKKAKGSLLRVGNSISCCWIFQEFIS